jgi:hypothetical protein
MRRKVIQHFTNMLPQRFLDLPDGFDLAIMASKGMGAVVFDLIAGTASIDGISQPQMRTSSLYRAWLLEEAATHRVPASALSRASMRVVFEVTELQVKESFGHIFRSANFRFECVSELCTDEKLYVCRASRSRAWGYAYYWEQLYGN